MWYTASLLLCNYRTKEDLPEGWQGDLPLGWRKCIDDYFSKKEEPNREDSAREERSAVERFCRFVSARGVAELTACEYAHFLDYLAWRRREGTTKRRLMQQGQRLANFLRYLWQSAGRNGDPLQGEDLREDLDWLDDWYEEIILLVQANSEEDALARARQHAQELVHGLQREARPGTAWKLAGITQTCELPDPKWYDGMEVFWRFLTPKEGQALARTASKQAPHLVP